jgi:tRNA(Ile)-lysidine synthase
MHKTMEKRFETSLKRLLPDYLQKRFVFAVSGGPDSVAMLHMAKACRLDGVVAHCHFHLRDNEADDDAAFVKSLADTLGYDFFIEHFDTISYAREYKRSVQMAARDLRYKYFQSLLKSQDADFIMLGHNRDDVAETMLINQLRGTGIRGLTGMPEKTETLVRPMLDIPRADIQLYLEHNQISWRQDSSNDETKYMRNKIRHDVLPALDAIKPGVEGVFRDNAIRLQRTRMVLDILLDGYKRNHFVHITNGIRIHKTAELREPALLYELLRDYGFTYDAIRDICDSKTGRWVESDSHVLSNERKFWVLMEKSDGVEKHDYLIEGKEFEIRDPVELHARLKAVQNVHIQADENLAQLDADKLNIPLKIRKWQSGDRFVPLGMKGFQKLSDFFINQKIGNSEKQAQWLLCSGDSVVWVIGKRLDDRFKITASTKTVCEIRYQPKSK